jgi:two-component system, OmpR family, response regulator
MRDDPTVIGICEDDAELRAVVADALRLAGFEVQVTASGTDAMRAFTQTPPVALILDIGLPDADGRDVCQALRARGVAAPVLFLTARDAVTDRVSGFAAGGDDYLTKPFALAELIARVRALVKRAPPAEPAASATGIRMDPATHSVTDGAASVVLTPTEYRLLAALAAASGTVVRRAALVAAAWPDGAIVHDNTLHAYLARIRRKLRHAGMPEAIETVRGVGYVLR